MVPFCKMLLAAVALPAGEFSYFVGTPPTNQAATALLASLRSAESALKELSNLSRSERWYLQSECRNCELRSMDRSGISTFDKSTAALEWAITADYIPCAITLQPL